MSFWDKLKNAVNVFTASEQDSPAQRKTESSYWTSQNSGGSFNERTILASIFTRIAIDCSQIDIVHCKIDNNNRYLETVDDSLNQRLRVQANRDQTGREFIQNLVYDMLDEGRVAIVPTYINKNIYSKEFDNTKPGEIDILSWRVGIIKEFRTDSVVVSVFDENSGTRKDIIVPKATTPIIQNPFFAIMNSPSSAATRLKKKLALLDKADDSYDPSKLDLIIQLPYEIRSENKRVLAEERRKDLEQQLTGSKYGIGYISATEKVTPLSRPLENNLLKEVEYFTKELMNQMNFTPEILNNTANEQVLLNYRTSIIEPIMTLIQDQIRIKCLTDTARSQNHSIMYFRNPFKLVPLTTIAHIAMTFTSNAIMSSNEMRQIIGLRPSQDQEADMLRNQGRYAQSGETFAMTPDGEEKMTNELAQPPLDPESPTFLNDALERYGNNTIENY